jgi:hypothetical protein
MGQHKITRYDAEQHTGNIRKYYEKPNCATESNGANKTSVLEEIAVLHCEITFLNFAQNLWC